jgi:phage gpG-like protein
MSLQLRDTLSPSLARLARGVENKRPILEAMGLQLESLTRRAFNEPGLRPAPWAPKWDGSPATLRKHQLLVWSIRVQPVTGSSVTVSSDRPYAAIHQVGGVIRAKPGKRLAFSLGGRQVFAQAVTLPARPFFPFIGGQMTQQAQDKIRKIGEAKIRELTQPGSGG